ncbi:MAG: cell division protein FtsZ, partial [Flavobacteriaceae bacterium]|nr:cell division protein FtsZ [Flavobacteriaceae bacterium]
GAAPIIAEMAKEFDILTVGIVTIPFNFEGKNRELQAVKGLEKLKRSVDSLIIINNNKLRDVYGNLGFKEGFSKADEVLATAARGVAQVITHHYTQNIDLKDAKTVLSNSGTAIMGSSITSGSNRANEAVIKALDSPLLNDNKIEGSKNVLLLIVSGTEEITIDEIGEINEYIQNETGNSANIIMGVGEDLELGNNISVTVIATGFGDEKQKSLVSSETKKVVYKLDQDHPFEKSLMNKDELDYLTHESDEIVEDKLNNESQQKKIESEINEILRNIDISYEVVKPQTNDLNLNDIELHEIEYVESGINTSRESGNDISFGLFSSENYSINNPEKEEFDLNDNHINEENVFEFNDLANPEHNQNDEKNEFDLNDIKDSELTNNEEDEIQFIKLDLDDEVSEVIEIHDKIPENGDNLDNTVEISENLFDKPLDTDLDNENLIRRENLKQFNYVFKNKNSTIEDLEKIPAYKRMGIEISNTKSQNEDIFSKTILNEDNKLEFPDVNTYLHDNVD